MLKKGSKLKSILIIKCPRCHQGEFLEKGVYDFSAYTSVRKNCPKCELKYRLEPSFYYGSMYVAYALGVAVMIAITLLSYLLLGEFLLITTFTSIIIAVVILAPYLNALSKIIWANFFFHYSSDWEKKKD